jgi:predicted RecB family nuclease
LPRVSRSFGKKARFVRLRRLDVCPRCLKEAVEKDDISLIYKMRKNSARALREAGICTVEQMAGQDVDALPAIPGASKDSLCRARIQALSLLEKRPIFIGAVEPVPWTGLNLYFDIEGDPWLDAEYLFGFWVVGDPAGRFAAIGNARFSQQDSEKYFLYFLAESPDKEEKMWQDFLAWLALLPDEYRVYHYANKGGY